MKDCILKIKFILIERIMKDIIKEFN